MGSFPRGGSSPLGRTGKSLSGKAPAAGLLDHGRAAGPAVHRGADTRDPRPVADVPVHGSLLLRACILRGQIAEDFPDAEAISIRASLREHAHHLGEKVSRTSAATAPAAGMAAHPRPPSSSSSPRYTTAARSTTRSTTRQAPAAFNVTISGTGYKILGWVVRHVGSWYVRGRLPSTRTMAAAAVRCRSSPV